jgi:hypothetical protein
MLEWIIVGGGVHGTYISNHLTKFSGVAHEKIRVIDRFDTPLAMWKRCTENTEMQFLRSPGEHNLDVGPGSLFRFASSIKGAGAEFYSKYRRPSLALFNAHCEHIIQEYSLGSMRHIAEVLSVKRVADGYVVETTSGQIAGRRLVLSAGSTENLSIPSWAKPLMANGSPIAHVFSSEFADYKMRPLESAVIIGGGISAVQAALALARVKPGSVKIVCSREFQTFQFDADPCWLGEKCLQHLRRQSDFAARRSLVDNARHSGSFPEDVRKQLDRAVKDGELECVIGEVDAASGDSKSVNLKLSTGAILTADLVVFATGFAQGRPGGALVNRIVEDLSLPLTECGFPILDEYLRWGEDLFVSGALAELTLGPASRNIIGARMSANRISRALHPVRSKPREYNYYFFRKRRTG